MRHNGISCRIGAIPMFDGVENRIARARIRHPRRQRDSALDQALHLHSFAVPRQTTLSALQTAACAQKPTSAAASSAASQPACRLYSALPSNPHRPSACRSKVLILPKTVKQRLSYPGGTIRASSCVPYLVSEAAAACVALDLLLCDTRNRF